MEKVRQVDVTPDEILASLSSPTDIKLTSAILKAFTDNGLTYKTRTQWKPAELLNEPDDFRVFCYIKKSKEALIINTKYSNPNKFCIQLRVLNSATFEKLDEYSPGIRNQILKARGCGNCGCKSGPFSFSYGGETYRKCHVICCSFWLSDFCDDDVDSVIDIVEREIEFGKPRERRSVSKS